MLNFLNLLFLIFVETRAEGEAGQGEAPEAGQGEAPESEAGANVGDGQGEGSPQGGQTTAPGKPRYGDFGDNPSVDDIYSKYQEVVGKVTDYEGKIAKMSATERNLSTLRKTLEGYGVKILSDNQGNVQLIPDDSKNQKRQSKFTDQHKAIFEEPVLKAIEALIEDRFADFFEKSFDDRFKSTYQRQHEQAVQLHVARQQANTTMVKMFPQLMAKGQDGNDNPAFNSAFYAKATEIWQNNPEYRNNPKGELFAAVEAAAELGITAMAVSAAKKEGFIKGQESKKVIGPVSSGTGQSKVAAGKLSKAEYLSLSDAERLAYDKKNLNIG